MQAQWKLSRAHGIANLLVLHRLSDLDAVGAAGSEARALAAGLLADCSTRVIYRQETDQLAGTERALGLTDTERDAAARTCPAAAGCGSCPRARTSSTIGSTPTKLALYDTDAAMTDGPDVAPAAGDECAMNGPRRLAERATLGALLLGDPTDADGRPRWLRPSDFADPWHREVYRVDPRAHDRGGATADAHGRRRGAARPARPHPRRRRPHRRPAARRPAARPTPPATPRWCSRPALRREVAGAGRAAAGRGAGRGHRRQPHARARVSSAPSTPTMRRRRGSAGAATANARHAGTAPRSHVGSVQVRVARGRLGGRDHALAASSAAARAPGPDAAEVAEHEAALVACLIAHPAAIGRRRAAGCARSR